MTVAGVQRCQLSRAADCRPWINGASLPRRPLALCYSSRLTVADVMCRHDEIRSSAGLSPTAGMKEEHLVLIRTRAQSWWYESGCFWLPVRDSFMYSSPALTVLVCKEAAINEGARFFFFSSFSQPIG